MCKCMDILSLLAENPLNLKVVKTTMHGYKIVRNPAIWYNKILASKLIACSPYVRMISEESFTLWAPWVKNTFPTLLLFRICCPLLSEFDEHVFLFSTHSKFDCSSLVQQILWTTDAYIYSRFWLLRICKQSKNCR